MIALSNAFARIMDGYAKLDAGNGRGGLPVGLQKGDGPLGTQLRPNQPPAAAHDAYHAPGSCSSERPATGYAFAFNARQVPQVEQTPAFTHRGSTEPGIVPATWPYSNPFTAGLPDQPYQPNRVPHPALKNLHNLNNPYPFAADMKGRLLDVFA
ncbi:MAG: hypothetical protein ACYC26_06130 [Phycisphaerales bacterium]